MEENNQKKKDISGVKKRPITVVLLVLILVLAVFSLCRLCLGACEMMENSIIENRKEPEQKKMEVEQWLGEKYGVVFQVLSVQTADVLTNYDTYRVVSVGTDENTDWFTVKEYKDRKNVEEIYEDDYLGIMLRDEMEQAVAELPLWEHAPVKVYIRRYFFPGSLQEYTMKTDMAEKTKDTKSKEIKSIETQSEAEEALDEIGVIDELGITGVSKIDIKMADVKAAGTSLDADYYIFLDAEKLKRDVFCAKTEELFRAMFDMNQPGLIRVYGLSEQAFLEIDRRNCEVYLQDYYRADGEKCLALARRVIK